MDGGVEAGWDVARGGEPAAGAATTVCVLSQRLEEIAEQVFPVFDAEREAHEAFADLGLVEVFWGPGGMGGAAGVAGEGFDSAEGDGVAGEFDFAEEVEGGGFAAFDVK